MTIPSPLSPAPSCSAPCAHCLSWSQTPHCLPAQGSLSLQSYLLARPIAFSSSGTPLGPPPTPTLFLPCHVCFSPSLHSMSLSPCLFSVSPSKCSASTGAQHRVLLSDAPWHGYCLTCGCDLRVTHSVNMPEATEQERSVSRLKATLCLHTPNLFSWFSSFL